LPTRLSPCRDRVNRSSYILAVADIRERFVLRLAAAGFIHAADCVLYEHRRDRARVVQVLGLTSSVLAYESVRASQDLARPSDIVIRALALADRPDYIPDEEVQGFCLLVVRNAACAEEDEARSAVAEAAASMFASRVIEQAMERFPASHAVAENGRCAFRNLLLASELRHHVSMSSPSNDDEAAVGDSPFSPRAPPPPRLDGSEQDRSRSSSVRQMEPLPETAEEAVVVEIPPATVKEERPLVSPIYQRRALIGGIVLVILILLVLTVIGWTR
jgi:hypothetical protein